MKNQLSNCAMFMFSGIFTGFVLISCESDDQSTKPYENGAFIVNEGTFGNSNGTIGFYSISDDSVFNDIFYEVNERTLGDIVQSVNISNNRAYIVVNNSNKIEVADARTFKELGVIPDLNSPRHFIANDEFGYVTCWGDNSVKVINLDNFAIVNSLPVASGPEKMCIINNKLYVANTGGWATDSLISVIDLSTNQVIDSIEVGYSPYDLVADGENLWVLCYGRVLYDDEYNVISEDPSALVKVNTIADTIASYHILFADQHPMQLEISSTGDLYFGGGYTFNGIYKFDTNSEVSEMLIEEYAYGLNIDPATDEIFITLSPDYTTAGSIKRYNTEGALLGTYTAGIGPNSVVF